MRNFGEFSAIYNNFSVFFAKTLDFSQIYVRIYTWEFIPYQMFLRRILQWHLRLVTSASLAAHAQMAAPLPAFPRVTASTLSTLTSASPAVTAQMYVL